MARERTLKVTISGDATQLNRALNKASKDADQFGKRTETMGKKFGASMKVAGAAAAGALAVGLKESVSAAIEAEKSQARLEAQLKASGISYRAHAAEIEKSIQATSKLAGLDDEDLADAFTNIVRVTGDVDKSLRLTGLAADFARAKHMDVAKAGELVGKVAGGNIGILSRYGIQIDKGASSTEALATLQQKFGGQAEAYGKTTAGAADRAKVGFENLQEVVGKRLTPTLAVVANKLANLADWAQKNPAQFKAVAIAIGGVVAALSGLKAISTAVNGFKALNLVMTANPAGLVIAGLVALGVALVTTYRKSETFRKIVDGAFRAIKTAARESLQFILGGLDKLMGAWSSMLRVLGKVPGFGWAKRAADSIDNAREKVRAFSRSLDGIPTVKDLRVRVHAQLPASLKRLLRDDNASSVTARPPVPLGRAAGGMVPGRGRGDTVPALLEPGEFVVQRKIVERFGPTFFAGLNDLQRFSSGGIVARANKLDRMHLPYLWGGGHGGRGIDRRGMDCSGAVSYVLGIAPRVSGALTSFGRPGPGSPNDTKIYANPVHTFMVINGRGFGTSRENPGGGPGWLSYNHRSGFTIRHLEDSGKGGTGDPQERSEPGKRKIPLGVRKGKGSSGGPAGKPVTGVSSLSKITGGTSAARPTPTPTATSDTTADTASGPDAPDFASVQGDAISTALGDVDLMEQAGVISTEQAQKDRLSMIDQWLAGAIGPLTQRQAWQLMAMRRGITEAADAERQSREENTAALKDLRDAIAQNTAAANSIMATSAREAIRALADVISGQIGGKLPGLASNAGSGILARYAPSVI